VGRRYHPIHGLGVVGLVGDLDAEFSVDLCFELRVGGREHDDFLASQGIQLLIAEMKGPVKDQCRRYGLDERFNAEHFYPTVGAAVDSITGTLRTDIDPTGDPPTDES
jgi:hypothetical protein